MRPTMYDSTRTAFTVCMNPTSLTHELISKILRKRSFCALASTSKGGEPHVAGVLYAYVNGALYISTTKSSKKARNINANPHVFVCVPVRRMPIGPPPSTVHFGSTAAILRVDDPEIKALVAKGHLNGITSHNELQMPDGCFLRIDPPATYLTYGLGMSLRTLAKDPLHAAGRLAL